MSEDAPDTTNPLEDMPVWKVLLSIGLQTGVFVALGLAIWVLTGRAGDAFVTFGGGEVTNGLLLALALMATSAALSRVFPRYVEWLVRAQKRNYPFLKHRISLAAIVFISLCAGIGEEAFFRAGLQTLLSDYLPMPLALAIAAALFALIHFAQPINSALIFAIGCLFGWVYWQTGSLLTVMIAHAVYDIYALWALQKAMHEMGVFEEDTSPPLPAPSACETFAPTTSSKGETP